MSRASYCFLVCLFAVVGCSAPSVRRSEAASVRFRDVAADAGLVFLHDNAASGEYFLPEIMGAGVALIDYDNDGDLDVFLVQSGKSGHRLFRNELQESGKLHFTDVSRSAGISEVSYGMGVATGDYDNDGFVDLFVTGAGRTILYHNNGNGTFRDVTESAGLRDNLWSSSAAFLDYDRDGQLDLFVLHYVDFTPANNKICYAATGERDYCTPKAYHGLPARLYRNLGGGRFRDVSSESGISFAYGPGLGVAVADFNKDGWPDLYVANDTARNLFWINQKNGRFQEAGLESGVAYAADGVARAGMGVTVGDFDRDDAPDIAVTNLMREGMTLFRNNGRGEFEDLTAQLGLTRSTVPFTGFGVGWLDADNDGDLDLLIANGAVTIMENQRGNPCPYKQTNQLLTNEGKRFRDMSDQAGDIFRQPGIGRGAAFGDIDNDGDIDVVITTNNGRAMLLRNDSPRRHWLSVRAHPGARVTVALKGQGHVTDYSHTDGSYLSASDPRVHFGLGDSSTVEAVTVDWNDGSKEQWRQVPVDSIVTLKKGSGTRLP